MGQPAPPRLEVGLLPGPVAQEGVAFVEEAAASLCGREHLRLHLLPRDGDPQGLDVDSYLLRGRDRHQGEGVGVGKVETQASARELRAAILAGHDPHRGGWVTGVAGENRAQRDVAGHETAMVMRKAEASRAFPFGLVQTLLAMAGQRIIDLATPDVYFVGREQGAPGAGSPRPRTHRARPGRWLGVGKHCGIATNPGLHPASARGGDGSGGSSEACGADADPGNHRGRRWPTRAGSAGGRSRSGWRPGSSGRASRT